MNCEAKNSNLLSQYLTSDFQATPSDSEVKYWLGLFACNQHLFRILLGERQKATAEILIIEKEDFAARSAARAA